MKYLAILKDSVRETIDSKVIYVLVALSGLLTLFVLTVSVKPQTAEKTMREVVEGRFLWWAMLTAEGKNRRGHHVEVVHVKKDPLEFRFKGVEVVRGAENSPDSAYRITVSLTLHEDETAENVRQSPEKYLQALRKNCQSAERYELLTVKEIRLADVHNRFIRDDAPGNERVVYFEVTTEPTAGVHRVWEHQFSLFFGAVPLGDATAPLGLVLYTSVVIVLWIGSLIAILGGVIITAFFIPNMLRKGTVDLLLVKPIHRWALLVYKYIGGLTFILINTSVAILGMWLALGLRTGIWANSFLLMIFVYTFFFAILYAVSTLFAVLTRSAVVAIMVTLGAWFLFFIAGVLHGFYEQVHTDEEKRNVAQAERNSDSPFWSVVRVIHFVLPRTSDVNELGNQTLGSDFIPEMLAQDMGMKRTMISWNESLSVSGFFIALMLGLSCWRFATKDY